MSTVNRTKPNDQSSEMDDEGVYCAEKSCRIAGTLACLGNARDADIAEALGIGMSDFHSWKDVHPEFAQALKTPPSVSDAAIERAALRTALGFSYTTEKIIETREGGVVRSLTIHVPPNVETLEFLLRAHMPGIYGQRAKMAKGPFGGFVEALAKQKPAASALANEELLDDEICRVAHVMARLWASHSEIAAALDISLSTFNDLRDRHVELAEALKSGKEMIHSALERALVQRASGYDYMGEEIFCSREGDVVRTRILKCVPPDTKAQDIWLRGCEARSSSFSAANP